MANYRLATVLASKSMGASGTEIIDILEADPISRIDIVARATNTAGAPTAHPAVIVSKIEIVDGSDVLYSLTGKQCRAMAFYSSGKQPIDHHKFLNDVQQITQYHLYFGRYLWDKRYALDPKKFKNLQLKITYTRNAGGIAPDALTFEIFALEFDELRVTPAGFFMQKEIFSYTGVASAWEYVDLPTDYPYRLICIDSEVTTANPNSVYNKIKLVEDNGKKVPIDEISVATYLKNVAEQFGQINEMQAYADCTATLTGYCTANYLVNIAATSDSSTNPNDFATDARQGGTFSIDATDSTNVALEVTGYIPHGMMPLLVVGNLADENDWYNVSRIGSLQLQIYGGTSAASGTIRVTVQQIRNY